MTVVRELNNLKRKDAEPVPYTLPEKLADGLEVPQMQRTRTSVSLEVLHQLALEVLLTERKFEFALHNKVLFVSRHSVLSLS